MQKQRSYIKDYKDDYPIGIVLGESKKEREKAKEIEKELSKHTSDAKFYGGIIGGLTLGIPAYLLSKKYSNDTIKSIGLGFLAAYPGVLAGKEIAPMLTRYVQYRNIAKRNNIDVGNFNYAMLDEGGQVARLMEKDLKDIRKYQKVNSELKAYNLIGGGLAGTAVGLPVAAAGFPVTGVAAKAGVSDLVGGYLKNRQYNKLINQ